MIVCGGIRALQGGGQCIRIGAIRAGQVIDGKFHGLDRAKHIALCVSE